MKVAFLDRDGVINLEKNYLYKVDDFEFVPTAISGLKRIISMGYKIIIVTNQAGIARGLYKLSDYYILTEYYLDLLKSEDIDILDVVFCPHHPDGVVKEFSINCECRKPKPGMIIEASKKFSIDLENSIMVGDKESDILAGSNAGVGKSFLVRTGHLLTDIDSSNDSYIVDDLISVSNYLSHINN